MIKVQLCGTIVTQNLGGYTWSKNSRLNRITRWSNDELLDMPSESIFIRDYSKNKYWRIGDNNLLATFGFGYAKYEQKTEDIKQEYNLNDEMYKELYENGGLAFHLKFMYPQTITNRRV